MEIWIGRNGERHGPYKEADVRQWLRSGQVAGDDLGWYDGLADWQPLSSLFPDELNQATSATPPPFSAAPLPEQATTVALEDYAGFWKRFAAYIVDSLVLYIPNLMILSAMGGEVGREQLSNAVQNAAGNFDLVMHAYSQYLSANAGTSFVTALVAWLYFAFCESSAWQATVGKLALGIRVTDLHGARISLPRALGRYPAKMLSAIILLFGFMMAGWTQRKQALHDMIAGTLVLNGRASAQRSGSNQSRSPSGSRFDA
ncbi:RDD family protein [Dyella lutea]|uniref:RDD family protein n=1 Tax=Dyella lutea TaxID=2950441 RepID=A0ABT1F6G6_9GAMM|nr:RDD family protein [Dyella lutea]MCP1372925.1 RDD family protein [Dyella lutea]